MTKNYSSSTLSVWRKSLNIVHSIVAPILFIWKQQYFKVIAVVNFAYEKINGSSVSLRKGYLERKKSIQDVLDRWSAHSSVGYALVVGFNAAMMLLMTTFAIEFAYHFRPYYVLDNNDDDLLCDAAWSVASFQARDDLNAQSNFPLFLADFRFFRWSALDMSLSRAGCLKGKFSCFFRLLVVRQ